MVLSNLSDDEAGVGAPDHPPGTQFKLQGHGGGLWWVYGSLQVDEPRRIRDEQGDERVDLPVDLPFYTEFR